MKLQFRELGTRVAECVDVDVNTLEVGQSVHVRRHYADRGDGQQDALTMRCQQGA